VKVKELTAAQGRALRKTTSTPNIAHVCIYVFLKHSSYVHRSTPDLTRFLYQTFKN
jgi:hypothetical protein